MDKSNKINTNELRDIFNIPPGVAIVRINEAADEINFLRYQSNMLRKEVKILSETKLTPK